MKNFYRRFSLKNLIKGLKYHKNPNNPSCINLILRNKVRRFQFPCVIETGLIDFHKIIVTVSLREKCPNTVKYRI